MAERTRQIGDGVGLAHRMDSAAAARMVHDVEGRER
jgi:hypothetical protein